MPMSHAARWGTTRNPWDLSKGVGGSSGGSAAALAAGTTTLATGTDIGGSIRAPAALAGVVGYKPPHGRVPLEPPANAETWLHAGALSRSVADTTLMANAMAGPHPGDRCSLPEAPPLPGAFEPAAGMRVAFCARPGDLPVAAAVAANTERVAAALAAAGVEIREVDFDWRLEEINEAMWGHGDTSRAEAALAREAERPGTLSPYALACFERALAAAAAIPIEHVGRPRTAPADRHPLPLRPLRRGADPDHGRGGDGRGGGLRGAAAGGRRRPARPLLRRGAGPDLQHRLLLSRPHRPVRSFGHAHRRPGRRPAERRPDCLPPRGGDRTCRAVELPVVSFLTKPNGVRLRYTDRGAGERTIVLVHGWKGSDRLWDPAVMRLAEDFRVVAFDNRGMGESDKPSGPYDFECSPSDLEFVLSELGVEDVTLVGWSMGCSISLHYLIRGGTRASRLVLINGPIILRAPTTSPSGSQPTSSTATSTALAAGWPRRSSTSSASRCGIPTAPSPDSASRSRCRRRWRWRCGSSARRRSWTTGRPGGAGDPGARHLRRPRPLLPGSPGRMDRRHGARRPLRVFENSAHAAHHDKADRFAATVGAFADEQEDWMSDTLTRDAYEPAGPYGLFVGGEEIAGDAEFAALDPSTGEQWATVGRGLRGPGRLRRRRGRQGLPRLAPLDPGERQGMLWRWPTRSRRRRGWPELLATENGRPIREARRSPTCPTAAGIFRYFAGLVRGLRRAQPLPTGDPDSAVYTMREPLGVIAALIPWNSPLISTRAEGRARRSPPATRSC